MLSEALFFVAFLVLLPTVVMNPFAGALAYEWLQYMPPYAVYNAYSVGGLSIIMGGLALAMFIFKDKKEKPKGAMGLVAIFAHYILWNNVTQLTSIVPAGVELWDRAMKVLIFTFFLAFMMRTRARIEAFIWIVCLAVGNYVFSGAVKTVLTGGGGYSVVGGGANILGERVSFAIAVSTMIPFVRYLRDHAMLVPNTRKRRIGFDIFTLACLATIVGTQARTGFVALAILAVFYFFKSKRKLLFLLALPVLVAIMLIVAPPDWLDRMKGIGSYNQDASAMGRIMAWEWGWNFTLAHPITGGGYHSYMLHRWPPPDGPSYLEAHNIFFETMADHGFVGLGIFLLLLAGCYFNCQGIRKRCRGHEELEWAVNLATAVQLALVTFIAGSQFLANATQSISYELVAISIATRGVVERYLAQQKAVPVIAADPARMRRLSPDTPPARPGGAAMPGRPAIAGLRSRSASG